MKLYGLTGGVGSGKSTAAGFFSTLGARLVDTDLLARELVQPEQPALALIRAEFGNGVIAADGGLNRREMARLVFADAAARKKLEAILHPRIRQRWQAQIQVWRREQCPVALVVIPLLFETGAEACFDKTICVACSPAVQRQRLQARGWPPGQIQGRLAAQWPTAQKIARSHYVIWTDGSLTSHRRQAEEIFAKL